MAMRPLERFRSIRAKLGSVIVLSGALADTPLALACVVLLAVISVVLFYIVVGLERLLLPWAREIAG